MIRAPRSRPRDPPAPGGRRPIPDPLAALGVDKRRPTPAYLQLSHGLAAAIRTGGLRPGAALPSERDLADRLGLSRMTVRRAFEALAADGLVEQRQGSGTYVAPAVAEGTVEQTVDRVLGFTEEARALGLAPGARLLAAALEPADRVVAAALELDPVTPVLAVTRLRTADGEPLALQTAYLAPALAELELAPLEAGGSLYRAIREQFGLTPARARQTVAARLASPDERARLGIGREVPVLALERTTFGPDERPFEYVRSGYRGDRYRMALDLRAPQP